MALPRGPAALLIGIAPTGGRLPTRGARLLQAIRAGLELHSGLHTFLGDDPSSRPRRAPPASDRGLPAAAGADGLAVGRLHLPGKRVILTVGTDCAIGKMSVALELRTRPAERASRPSFVPTGQTGMMIEGWGVAVDRVISDFLNGTVEWLCEQGEGRGTGSSSRARAPSTTRPTAP